MDKAVWVIVIVVFVGAVLLTGWQGDQNERRIQDWAKSNSFEIVEVEKPLFSYGPFWVCDDDQTIYKVTVRDSFEKEYISWFRLPANFSQDWQAWDKGKTPHSAK